MGIGLPSASAADTGLIASDSMHRTVAQGFGNADTGGAYSVSGAKAAVSGNHATFSAIAPGGSASANLNRVQVLNADVTLSFVLPALPKSGSGLDIGITLRHASNGNSYHARVAELPNGQLKLAVGRNTSGAQVVVGGETTIAQKATPGQVLNVEAEISATTSVAITLRAWIAGNAKPSAWQHTVHDAAATRITSAGAVGAWVYSSSKAGANSTVSLAGLSVYNTDAIKPVSPVRPKPSPSTPKPTPNPTPAPTPGTGGGVGGSGADEAVGSAAIGSTSYAIPAGALFVAATGNDNAIGDKNSPLRTVAKAISTAKSGTTIVLRAGTYHESVTVPATKSLTIQSYPHEAVWFDGSSAVSSWKASGNTWVADNWTAKFDSSPTFTKGSVPSGAGWSFINPTYPMASHPDQVWVDGASLAQVGSVAQVTAGTFYVNYATNQLVIGSNPGGHSVRASDIAVAITTYGPNDIVRGIGVHRYATPMVNGAAVRLQGSHNLLENAVVSNNATSGITANALAVTVRNVTIEWNGLLGMQANKSDQLVIANVLATHNNSEHFNNAPASGGIKVAKIRTITVKNTVSRDNFGPGIWLDESCYNMTVVDNTITNNQGHGLILEISSTGLTANNLITGNSGIGIKLNNTDNMKVWNNTVGGNQVGIDVVEDSRRGIQVNTPGHDSRQPNPDPTEPWIIRNVQIVNNVLNASKGSGNELSVRDASHTYAAAQLNITVNGNRFEPRTGVTVIAWQLTTTKLQSFASVVAFASALGRTLSNTEGAGKVAASAHAGALPLPAAIASVIGSATGLKHAGSF